MSENSALVPASQMSYAEVMSVGEAMAQSGYFSDAREATQAIVKILAGREMGFGPFAAMSGIHIIKGKPAIGANLMAAAVKGHPKYDYRVAQMDGDACEIAYFQGSQEIGRSRFTKDDAARAGTGNMGKYPRNMLFARAMSNGVKWFCPDVFLGAPVYTPDELGATVDDEGEIIEVTPTVTPPPPTAADPPGDAGDNGDTNGKRKGFGLSETAMKTLLDKKLAEHPANAARMVNLSSVLNKDSTDAEIVSWATVYRAARDGGTETEEAAKQADAQLALEAAHEEGE